MLTRKEPIRNLILPHKRAAIIHDALYSFFEAAIDAFNDKDRAHTRHIHAVTQNRFAAINNLIERRATPSENKKRNE